jgi:hypothetical protein
VCGCFSRPYGREYGSVENSRDPFAAALHAIPASSPMFKHDGLLAKRGADTRLLAGMSWQLFRP